MFDLNPTADALHAEFKQTQSDWRVPSLAHDFLMWIGTRIEKGPTAGDVMEFLWGYLPLHKTYRPEPLDGDRVALNTFLSFLGEKGFDVRAAKDVAIDKRTFTSRYRAFRTVPFSPWAEELRLMVKNAGFESTIPPADPADVLGRGLALVSGKPGLLCIGSAASEPVAPRPEDVSAVPGLQRIAHFVQFLGNGRKLTKKGNMTLADGKALAEAFGEGHLFDEKIGDKVFKTVSSSQIPSVDLTLNWARAAGFATVRHGRIQPTARGRRLGRDPVDDWRKMFRSFVVKLKWMEKAWAEDFRPFWAPIISNFGCAYLGHAARREESGIAVYSLALETWNDFSIMYRTDHLDETRVRSEISSMEGTIRSAWFEPLALLGACEVWMSAVEGAVRLTNLGQWGTSALFEEFFGDEGSEVTEPEPPDIGSAEILMFPAWRHSPNGHSSH